MNTGKQQISATQLMFSIGCFIQGSTLLSGFVTSVAKHESWLTVIMGYIVSLPIIWIYIKLAQLHPQKNIVEINISVFGNVLGRVISVLYVFFFLSLAFLNAGDMLGFVSGYIMPETPKLIIIIMFIFVCAMAVRKGVETFTRYGLLFIIINCIVILFNGLLLLENMKLSKFLPILTLPTIKYIQATHTVAILPFGEIFAFLMLIPYVKKTANIKKAFYGGSIIGIITFIVVIVRDTAVLGALIAVYVAPTFEVIRMIDVFDILTRMEVLYATILLMTVFFKITILFFAAVMCIAQVLNLQNYKILVPAFGVIIIVLTSTAFSNGSEGVAWGANYGAIYATFFELILPAIMLATTLIKNKLKSSEQSSEPSIGSTSLS